MEAWDMRYKPNSDWNHAWEAAPANIIVRQLWGITPLTPGFRKTQIKPQTGGLSYSLVSVPTILGPINAIFKSVSNNVCIYGFDIPYGMEAEFAVPDHKEVFINGNRTTVIDGKIELRPGHTDIEIRR